jgi:hypothetical protein
MKLLDFWRDLYIIKEDSELGFEKGFRTIIKGTNDSTKPLTRYKRWSRVFEKLPRGSYLSCTVYTSHWRMI